MRENFKSIEKKAKKVQFNTILGVPYYLMLVILVILPLFIMVLYAFTKNNASLFNVQFTFDNFIKFFKTPAYVGSMFESIWLAIRSTFICLLICYPLAYFVTKLPRKKQTIVVLLLTSSMWINSLILMHSLKNVFIIVGSFVVGSNAQYNELTLFLGHDYSLIIGTIFLYMPYMFLPIYTQMTKIDKNLLEGAADLGANKFQTLTRVVFPLTLSSVISSCLVVLLPATTTLVVSEIMGAGQRPLIGNLIERQQGARFGEMAAYSLILAVAMLIIVLVLKMFDRYEEVLSHE